VIVTRQLHNLVLIGLSGVGKSCVGRLAADILHFTFLDTDAVIEARAGKHIREIFEQGGEPIFRQWEGRIVQELARRKKTVVATGGGLPAGEGNLESLKSHSLVVCLWASPEKIWERVRDQTHRPLLNQPDQLAQIRRLLESRENFYRQADVLVNTEFRSLREVAMQVVHQYHLAQAAHRTEVPSIKAPASEKLQPTNPEVHHPPSGA
jgi:shikimate kinase